MEVKPKILAIIPARSGSKGIAFKNIKPLAGKPLIAYTIESAQQSKYVDKLILSSDDVKIIEVAKTSGVDVPFKRPAHLAKDNSGSLEVVQHTIQFFEKQDEYYDAVILLQPTTPFREAGFIDQAIKTFMAKDCDSLVSVLPVPHQFNPHWVFEPNKFDNLQISTGDDKIIKRRQELPKAFFRDGSIYITKVDVIKKGSFYGEKLTYIESNPKNYVNIDTVEDWSKAKIIVDDYKKRQGNEN